jgi:hypothetical protein
LKFDEIRFIKPFEDGEIKEEPGNVKNYSQKSAKALVERGIAEYTKPAQIKTCTNCGASIQGEVCPKCGHTQPKVIGTLGTKKTEKDIQHIQYISPNKQGSDSSEAPVLMVSSDEEIVANIYRYQCGDVEFNILDRKGRDHIQVIRDETIFTDRVRLRDSEHSRKILCTTLEEKALLFKKEATKLVDVIVQDLIQRPISFEAPISETVDLDLGSIIENPLNPEWILEPRVFKRSLQFLTDPDLFNKTDKFIEGFLVSDPELREDLIYNQVSVCAPPLRRYNPHSGDYLNERGQEALIVEGGSGFGKGATTKMLRYIGVRVVNTTRITRAALERYARELLHHTTLIINEIDTIYRQGEDREVKESDATAVVSVLKQAIEDNKITLILMERDEEGGGFKPRVFSSEVYPAPIMMSIYNIKDVQMATRAKPTSLPESMAGFLSIGDMVGSSIMLETTPKITVNGHMTGSDVKLVFHTIAAILEGLIWEEYQNLGTNQKTEIDQLLQNFGLNPDYLRPVAYVILKDEARKKIHQTWTAYIVEFTLQKEIEIKDEDSKKKLTRNDVIKMAYDSKNQEIIEIMQALGRGTAEVEGMTRDLLHAYRRAQSHALFNIFRREYKLSEESKRIIQATDTDAGAGVKLLKTLIPRRMKTALTAQELRILEVLRENPGRDMTVRQVATTFYGETTEGRIRYVRRALNNAAEEGYLIKTPGNPNYYCSEIGLTRKPEDLKKYTTGTNGTEDMEEDIQHTSDNGEENESSVSSDALEITSFVSSTQLGPTQNGLNLNFREWGYPRLNRAIDEAEEKRLIEYNKEKGRYTPCKD